jgi:alpha-glucosidase
MYLLLAPALLAALLVPALAAEFTPVGAGVAPGGKLRMEVGTDAKGHLAWRVDAAGKPVIGVSKAGVLMDDKNYGAGAKIGKPVTRTIDETFPWRGPASKLRNHCQVAEFPVQSNGIDWIFEVRTFDHGTAYRCRIPGTGKRHIDGEAATFALPAGVFCHINHYPVTYEVVYKRMQVETVEAKEGIGMPTVFELPGGGYAAITEANTMGWSGMNLEATGTSVFNGAFRDDPQGWDVEGEIVTPWRVVMVAEDLDTLVHSQIVSALCPAPDPKLFPQGVNTPWLKPGRSLWQWWAFDSPGTHWSKQKGFIDKAAELNCQYYLVDEGWEHTHQEWFTPGDPEGAWPRMKELCDYAKTKGVGIWAWRGWWTADPKLQWPGLETHAKRVDFFRRCREVGIAGVKIDFMDSESHDRLNFYQDCLKVAAENQIMVNFHGANKPAGEERTWPNEMTREGIRGMEFNKWDTNLPHHYATLPFTRLLVGHGDFTPTALNPKFLKGTTVGLQLASAIVLSTPILCWADSPELYLASPAVDVIRTMPTVWDESRVLPPSQIGELAAFARRSGDEWWVGVVNGAEKRSVYLSLDFLGAGEWVADSYGDGAQPTDFDVKRGIAVSSADSPKVEIATGGGVTMRIRKK